jgi:hypothetical protein
MRLKRSNPGAPVSALALLVVLSAMALAPAPASALPEGRVYEQVSPVYKAGFGASIYAVAPDGESVVFNSLGAFAGLPRSTTGNDYIARREDGKGWFTLPEEVPFTGYTSDFSSTLEYVLGGAQLGPEEQPEELVEGEFLLHRADTPDIAANWEVFGGLTYKVHPGGTGGYETAGASGDLCHVLAQELAGGPVGSTSVLDASRGCGGELPSVRSVGVRNRLGGSGEPEAITATCWSELGLGLEYSHAQDQETRFNAISADGRELFFTANVEEGIARGGNACGRGRHQLFVRVGGSRTLEVSRPLDPAQPFGGCGAEGEVPCPGAAGRASADFKGASEDGSRVFFTTDAPLASEDQDAKNDLYITRIGCPAGEPRCEPGQRQVVELVQVSHDTNVGQAAEVQSVVRVAPDGSRVYFVARGVLGEGANAEGLAPVKGADNLYVWEPDPEHEGRSKTVFVADLCSGPALSGEASDPHCPDTLEPEAGLGARNDMSLMGREGEAQSPSDGRVLVFSTYARLITRGPQADSDTAKDIYRYDAQTGALDRVSIGEAGYDANANNSAFDATITNGGLLALVGSVTLQHEMSSRAVSEDGRRIVFSTAEPLSPDAINHLVDIYEWHKEPGWSEGQVSLISSGSAQTNDLHPVITPSGRDVFFTTSQGLVPQDTESDLDVYDARLGGGFPPSPAERQQCSSDACQGPLTNPAPLLVPGSVSQAPGQSFVAPAPTKAAVKPKAKACKKGYVKKKGKCVKKVRHERKGKKSRAKKGSVRS